jgi:ribosome assembly protein YihI (activator of Der GTPase)
MLIKKHIDRKKIKKKDPLIIKKKAIPMIIIELNIL